MVGEHWSDMSIEELVEEGKEQRRNTTRSVVFTTLIWYVGLLSFLAYSIYYYFL